MIILLSFLYGVFIHRMKVKYDLPFIPVLLFLVLSSYVLSGLFIKIFGVV